MRKIRFLAPCLLGLILLSAARPALAGESPSRPRRNVILLVGDGMGLAAVAHAHIQQFGAAREAGRLNMERLPVLGYLYTGSADALVTDSAAAGTALFSGEKTCRGSLGVDKNGQHLKTVFEEAHEQGLAVGVITTVPITHATPAATYAHVIKRRDYHDIFDWLLRSRFDVLLGAGKTEDNRYLPGDFAARARQAGYAVCRTAAELSAHRQGPVLGIFGQESLSYEFDRKDKPSPDPHLSDLVTKSLDLIGSDPDGFVLMVEGGSLDSAAHEGHFGRLLAEVLEFDRCVALVCDWVERHSSWSDTLVVVTADHETGELAIRDPRPDEEQEAYNGHGEVNLPAPGKPAGWRFGSAGHSAVPVIVFSRGVGSERLAGAQDNTNVCRAIRALLKK